MPLATIAIFNIFSHPLLASQKYPREDAAHIAVRTTRRFLEKYGDSVDKLCFSFADKDDIEIYKRVIPLYFPRNEGELSAAIRNLPECIGNEDGETGE